MSLERGGLVSAGAGDDDHAAVFDGLFLFLAEDQLVGVEGQ